MATMASTLTVSDIRKAVRELKSYGAISHERDLRCLWPVYDAEGNFKKYEIITYREWQDSVNALPREV